MRIITPLSISTTDLASSIDIDDDGYEQWSSGLPYNPLLLVGCASGGAYRVEVYQQGDEDSPSNFTKLGVILDGAFNTAINGITASPNGQYVVVVGEDSTPDVSLYVLKRDIQSSHATGLDVLEFDSEPSGDTQAAVFLSDSVFIYSSYMYPYVMGAIIEDDVVYRYHIEIEGYEFDGSQPKAMSFSNGVVVVEVPGFLLFFRYTNGKLVLFGKKAHPNSKPVLSYSSHICDVGCGGEIAVTGGHDPALRMYEINDKTTISILTDNLTLPLEYGGADVYGQVVRVSSTGRFLAMGTAYPPFLHMCNIEDYDNVLEDANISAAPAGIAHDIAWQRGDLYIAVGHNNSPYVSIYSVDSVTGDLTKISNPASLPTAAVYAVCFLPASGYFLGDTIYYGTKLYESAINNNRGIYPDSVSSGSPVWLDAGWVNRWRMFDGYGATKTSDSSTITQTITKTGVSNVSLFGLDATSVQIKRLSAADAVLWTETEDVTNKVNTIIDLDQATVAGEKVQIVVANTAGDVEVANCILGGTPETIGNTMYGFENEAQEFGIKAEDDWGRMYLDPGLYADIVKADVLVDVDDYSKVGKYLRSKTATSCVWDFNSSSTTESSLVVYGFYQTHRRVYQTKNVALMTIEVQELT